MLFSTILLGLVLGGTYALVALGLTLQYGIARIMNLAYGELIIAASFVAFALFSGLGLSPVLAMAVMLSLVWIGSLVFLRKESGKAKFKPKFKDLLSKSRPINILSGARFLLFGARDVWFVVALPVFLASQLNWTHWQVGSFLALWVIGYGVVQSVAPRLTQSQRVAPHRQAVVWGALLTLSPLLLSIALWQSAPVAASIIIGLGLFGALFAVNSSLHSYLIVSYSRSDGVSLDVGFYYMANAAGRLLGTILSGWIYQQWGLVACLGVSVLLLLGSTIAVSALPARKSLAASASD